MTSLAGDKVRDVEPVVNQRFHSPAIAGWHAGGPPIEAEILVAAEALAGSRASLKELLSRPDIEEFATKHNLGAVLALLCRRAGIEPVPPPFNRELYWATCRHLLVAEEMRRLGAALGAAGVPWLTIKGADLATRIYAHPCERALRDVDILVRPEDLARTIDCLQALGWLDDRSQSPNVTDLLSGERYNLAVGGCSGLLVELHYRLWGWMPEGMVGAIVAASEARVDWGSTARRPSYAWAFILGAVHVWQAPRPRPLAAWRDMERISAVAPESDLADQIIDLSNRWAVQLPVALTAWHVAALWRSATCTAVASRLFSRLRPAEALAATRFAGRGEAGSPLSALVAARLFSHRPSRLGYRSVTQVLWPTPEIVASLAPVGSGLKRRLVATAALVRRAARG